MLLNSSPSTTWNLVNMPTRKRREQRVPDNRVDDDDYGLAKRLRLNTFDVTGDNVTDVNNNNNNDTATRRGHSNGSLDTSPGSPPYSDLDDEPMDDDGERNSSSGSDNPSITMAPELDNLMRERHPIRLDHQARRHPPSTPCLAVVPFVPRPIASSTTKRTRSPDDQGESLDDQGELPDDQGKVFTLDDCRATGVRCKIVELVDAVESMDMQS